MTNRGIRVPDVSWMEPERWAQAKGKTPLPFVYVVMIKQLILVYLATLPIAVCNHCGWWSPVLVAIVSLGLFGMEEASVEIEDPFGTRENCLDMVAYTLTITRDAGQLAALKAGGLSTVETSE